VAPADAPYGVVVDGTYVYWIENRDTTVMRAPKTGGTTTMLYDGGDAPIGPGACALDPQQQNIFFTDINSNIFRLPLTGGVPTLMDSTGSNMDNAPVVADSTSVYYGAVGRVLRAPRTSTDGGTPIANVANPAGLAYDPAAQALYWANYGVGATDGTIGRVSIDGGSPSTLAGTLVTPAAVTLSGPYVLWISAGTLADGGNGANDPNTGALYRLPK
jgi:hypothetical protein